MRSVLDLLVLGAAACLVPSGVQGTGNEPASPPSASATPAPGDSDSLEVYVCASLARLPLTFVENRGQWEGPVRFVARRPGGASVYLAPDSVWIRLVRVEGELSAGNPDAQSTPATGPNPLEIGRVVGVNLRLVLEGASEGSRLVGLDESPTLYHFFLGNDPSRWRTDVRGFGKAVYRDLHEGVDLVVRENDSILEYDLVLEPGADLSGVVVRVEGSGGPLRVDAEGTLVIDTTLGEIRQPRPRAWEQGAAGDRRPVPCSCRILGEDRFGFEVPSRSEGSALVVDPQLLYSTFLAGGDFQTDSARAMALDGSGFAVVAGSTACIDFPITPGAFDTDFDGTLDAFVTRLSLSGGAPTYSTFLGGSGDELPQTLALDAAGATLVAGSTDSTGFPTTPGAFDTTYNGGSSDTFLTRLPIPGSASTYSTLLGGSGSDVAYAISLDATGSAVLAGQTDSPNFPVSPGAFDTSFAGVNDVYVTRLPLTGGPPSYSTLLGGLFQEQPTSLSIDATGAAVLSGFTFSLDFPTTPGAFDTVHGPFTDGFVSVLALLPVGASTYGASTPGCAGPLPIGITSIPQVGNSAFAITCGHAPPSSGGLLGVSAAPLATPLTIRGAQFWLDVLSPAFFAVGVVSDPAGVSQVTVPIPAIPSLAGSTYYVQWAWVGPSSPAPCPPTGVSASNALEIILQP